MPTKQKNQHLIPRCYLANFISAEVPAEHQGKPHFEHGIWTTAPTLDNEWKMQGIGNLLARSYAYELPGDTPHVQEIERFLSAIESPWPDIIQTLSATNALSVDQETDFRNFLSTLYQRTDAMMSMVQGWAKLIETLYRQVEKVNTGQVAAADSMFSHSPNVPKSLIKDGILAGVVQGHRLHFIRNSTNRVFLTSDAPVLLTHLHPDEVARLVPSPALISPSATGNLRRPLILCPLTPTLMLIVSEFISDGYPGYPFLTLTDPLQVALLNLLTIENAQDLVLSSVRSPLGNDQSKIAALLREGSCGGRDKGTWMLLYTNRRRYWLPLDSYTHTIQEIEFMTPALQHLKDASEDDRLESLEVFVDGRSREGMHEIQFDELDLTGSKPTRIGSKVKLPISKSR